nr:hypothetical protein [Sulfurimonas sp. SAG-AH-194-I05]
MNLKAKVHGERLTIICHNDKEICYLLNAKKEIVEDFEFKEKIKTFLIKEDEILEPTRYQNIELTEEIYFEPTLIYKRLSPRLFETLIYYTSENTWVYVSPFFDDTKEFINKEEIISYIKKREYLPMYSGLAEE